MYVCVIFIKKIIKIKLLKNKKIRVNETFALYTFCTPSDVNVLYVGWLCLTSHRQRGHLETAPPFTVPCEGREAR